MNDLDLKKQIELIKNPSEFNKPECHFIETGCPIETLVLKNQGCPNRFSKCYDGWVCDFTCKKDKFVYNYLSNRCQEIYSRQKSMREDL